MANANQVRLMEQLTHEAVLRDTCWLYYCCCAGYGCGRYSDPTCGSKGYCCCLSSLAECHESECCSGEDGCCGTTSTVCCIVEHAQFPPSRGAPRCALLGLKCGGGGEAYQYEDMVYDYKKVFNDTFWLAYLCCCGFGCAAPGIGRGHWCGSVHKLCCIRRSYHSEACCKDGICCESTGTTCCLWSEGSFPPHKDSPCIALFGLRLKTPSGDSGKPSQLEMQ